MKQKVFFIFDTETQGVEKKLVYDIGWNIVNRRGEILHSDNYLVREIVTDAGIMSDAFYHRKIYTDYLTMLDNSEESMIKPWAFIASQIRADVKQFGVNVFSAYNLGFDADAMRQTAAHCNAGYTLENKPEILDLWLFACLNLFTQKDYKRIADALGWRSDAGNYRTTAEHAYRYITGNWNFAESHTALDDANIETDIFADLMRNKRKIPYNVLNPHPWRLAQ